MEIKGIIKKFIENTLAYALPVILQQFIVYPLIAKKLGATSNGLFLSLLALNYFIINITASVLVNVRLLQNEKYAKEGVKGDYNIILLFFACFDVFFVIIGSIFYSKNNISIVDVFLSGILVLLFLYHDYITVQYRVELMFNKILINNIILCVGYLLGIIVLYFISNHWQFVFIIPYTMTLVYDMKNTNYIKESFIITAFFSDTIKQYFILMGATLLNTAVTYGDRLLLYPLLDGESVSVFSAAQLIGKMMQMLSTPITSFVLAYLVRKSQINIKIKIKYVFLGIIGLTILYVTCVIISYPMIHFLYPMWANESLKYVRMTALNGIILMLGVILNVIVLRFLEKKYQLIKSILYLVTYIGFSFALVRVIGLWGFCLGNLISSIVQLIYLVIIVFKKKIIEIDWKEKKANY